MQQAQRTGTSDRNHLPAIAWPVTRLHQLGSHAAPSKWSNTALGFGHTSHPLLPPRSPAAAQLSSIPVSVQVRPGATSELRHPIWGALQAGDPAFHQQRNALHMGSHREDTDGPERERDPLRAAALRRRNQSLTCGDAAPGDCRRRSGVARLCESKRAHSEPSCQRALTITRECSPPPWRHRVRSAPG